ncbi:MAG: hypothetical protein QOE71_1070 [Pseudonocardiales bacterium]|nr:hypothetical protein [Pseudonocardiales bacterium]
MTYCDVRRGGQSGDRPAAVRLCRPVLDWRSWSGVIPPESQADAT